MSDRRAYSAGHAALAGYPMGPSVADEMWRVAVGGNRVENMTAEQITQAYHAGHLSARTPLWPPGAAGWQALGHFQQFQLPPPGYAPSFSAELSQFQENDDDPTRMWTGSADLELSASPYAAVMAPPSAPMPVSGPARGMPAGPMGAVHSARPSARTGPRPVSTRAPRPPANAAMYGSRVSSAAPATISSVPPPFRNKSNGWSLVAGLVGLVGLGSAVLAARGDWGATSMTQTLAAAIGQPARAEVEAAATPPAPATTQRTATPEPPPEAAPSAATEAAVASAPSVNDVANYEEGSATSALAASDEHAADQPTAGAQGTEAADSDTADDEKGTASATASVPAAVRRSAKASSKRAVKRSTRPARATQRSAVKRPARAPAETASAEAAEPAEEEKEPQAARAAGPEVNEAAAAALANSAKLASSCRPRGGPSGSGKARIIYSQEGEVQSVEILTAKFRDTLTGSCVRMVFRRAKIPAFKGEPPTFIKGFNIPEE